MDKNILDIKLGSQQICPLCNSYNPSGLKLPEKCLWCKGTGSMNFIINLNEKENLIMNDLKFIGMDPSYNGFGIIILDNNANIIREYLLTSKSDDEVEDRILSLEQEFKFICDIENLQVVYIEGPSFSSQGAFVLQMGALHYFLRIFFRKNNINYKVIPPGNLKKFVTGKGQCKKELILLKTYKKWGIEFSDNNLADAYGLARLAVEDFKPSE